MTDTVRRRLVVHGYVHGVGFRVSVARVAQRYGVAGWVRNRPDGTVEAVLEGDRDSVDALVRYCHEGPRSASVTGVEAGTEEPVGLAGFEIR